MSATIRPDALHMLLLRAAISVRAAVGDLLLPETECPHPALSADGGLFVTLLRKGELAGCIGYVSAPWPLWETVARAARSAALEDPRFGAIQLDQLDHITVEVSVLSPLREIDPEDIEVGRDGLLIECGGARGLLLPKVATDLGWNREAFLAGVSQKAGLPPEAWRREDSTLWAFSAQVVAAPMRNLSGGTEA